MSVVVESHQAYMSSDDEGIMQENLLMSRYLRTSI